MYRHTFHLIGDEEISFQSNSQELPTCKYGEICVFYVEKFGVKYTIPVMSVLYVETEEYVEE